MKLAATLIVGPAFLLAGCASGAKPTAHDTTTPPTTIAGVGVTTVGPPPKPTTPTACARRWNGTANANGRQAAQQRAPKATTAIVRMAGASGHLSADAGRCLVYLITARRSATVFVEAARGRFVVTADATGTFVTPNADLQRGLRLRPRATLLNPHVRAGSR
jgi:hypothetical protein